MSKWSKFAQGNSTQRSGETMPHPTMRLRQVIKKNGSISIEQLVEHRNSNNQVVGVEWTPLPTIYEE